VGEQRGCGKVKEDNGEHEARANLKDVCRGVGGVEVSTLAA